MIDILVGMALTLNFVILGYWIALTVQKRGLSCMPRVNHDLNPDDRPKPQKPRKPRPDGI